MCLDQSKLQALLGRPLTTVEVSNLSLYLKIANAQLEELICTSVESITETRTFDARDGYRTVFTDIFNQIDKVEIDGVEIDAADYSARQWDRRNADWYNSIVFDEKRDAEEIEVTADWGFGDCLPSDLQSLVAGLFGLVSKKNTTNSLIQTKQVEDFRISFKNNTTVTDQFILDNQGTINKYSMCDIGQVVSGEIRERCYGYRRF